MMTTASASIPTNSTPMDVSSDSGEMRGRNEMALTMMIAAASAPRLVSKPTMKAIAMPGSTPCTSASPRKFMLRSTTHVPTSEVVSTASSPASERLGHEWLEMNGSIHQPTGSVRNVMSSP